MRTLTHPVVIKEKIMYKLDFDKYLIEYYGMMNDEFNRLPNNDKSIIRKEYNKYLQEKDDELDGWFG